MLKHAMFTLVAILALAGQARAQALKTDEEKTIYALGLMMGKSIQVFNLSKAELEIVKRGLADAVTGAKPQVDVDAYTQKVDALARGRGMARAEAEKAKSKAYLELAAREKGAHKTATGLVLTSLKAGTGASPKATDRVKVHYRGTLIDGTEFDSSYQRNQPAEFALNQVIPCWTEGLQATRVGCKARLVCPSDIAYGNDGRPPSIPGGATLIFEVELLDIVK